MEDGLSGFFACVDDEAEAAFLEACFQGDFLHYQEEIGEVFVVFFIESQKIGSLKAVR